MSHLNFEKFLT